MTDLEVRASAFRAVDGARDLAGAGRSLAARRQDLGAEIATAAAGRPWGDDEAGQAFDRRYRAIEWQVLDACAQLAAYVESLGNAAERSATALTLSSPAGRAAGPPAGPAPSPPAGPAPSPTAGPAATDPAAAGLAAAQRAASERS